MGPLSLACLKELNQALGTHEMLVVMEFEHPDLGDERVEGFVSASRSVDVPRHRILVAGCDK